MEGENVTICVEVRSPQDIGSANIYLEVLPAPNPAGAGDEASKNIIMKKVMAIANPYHSMSQA